MKIKDNVKPYGMGVDKLADTLSIPKEEAAELFKVYAEAFPVLNNWLEAQGKLAVSRHYSTTLAPCKRRRWYPDMQKAIEKRKSAKKGDKTAWKEIMITEGQTHRNGMNSPIQG
jgi:DNA polymerase I-like protein with 3'-5' exonuclease and polymerase domains